MPAILPSKGRLRVYLGPAAGVGKTYAMLGDARIAREDGVDVVIGYLEPHGRERTESRAASLERAPVLRLGGGGRAETELDLDWLFARRPAVCLVDELAHSNAVGARHERRHEDVAALLAAGIDVWTTVNIQHLESLRDEVASLVGVEMTETFPDRVLAEAEELRLIDLSPGALRERIASGLVYPSDRIERALSGFFRPQRLAALRALALHELAEVAARDLERLLPRGVPGAERRVLVATGGLRASMSALIRAGERLARRSDSELFVLAVEPTSGRLDAATAGTLAEAEALTSSLGGTFLRRSADDTAAAIVREAKAQGATDVILGRSRATRRFRRAALSERVSRDVEADIHILEPRRRRSEPVDG